MPFRIPLRAPEGSEGGSAAAAAGSAVATDAAAATTTQAGQSLGASDIAKLVADAVGAAVAPFRSEIVDFRREVRNKFSAGTAANPGAASTATATTGTAAAAVWGPSEQLAFRDSIEEAGVVVSVEQRRILETLVKAEGGNIPDPISWVRSKAEAFGWRKAAATAAAAAAATTVAAPVAAVATAAKTVDTGAPAGTTAGASSLPDDPSLLTQSQIDAMSDAEAQAHYKRWQARTGRFVHPFAAARERAKGGGDLAAAAAIVANALKK